MPARKEVKQIPNGLDVQSFETGAQLGIHPPETVYWGVHRDFGGWGFISGLLFRRRLLQR